MSRFHPISIILGNFSGTGWIVTNTVTLIVGHNDFNNRLPSTSYNTGYEVPFPSVTLTYLY